MYLYADDAKLFGNNVNDLQSSLSRLSTWLWEHQLFLTPSKCEHLCIFLSLKSHTHNFCVDSYNIRSVTAVKDLGVYIFRGPTKHREELQGTFKPSKRLKTLQENTRYF